MTNVPLALVSPCEDSLPDIVQFWREGLRARSIRPGDDPKLSLYELAAARGPEPCPKISAARPNANGFGSLATARFERLTHGRSRGKARRVMRAERRDPNRDAAGQRMIPLLPALIRKSRLR